MKSGAATPAGAPLIEASNLVKHFGPRVAVNDISFRAGRGEVLGLLGPNGAGKTTLLRMLAGLLRPTSGSVRLDGVDLETGSREARQPLAYLPEQVAPYDEMTVLAYLRFQARMWGMRGADAKAAADRALTTTDLDSVQKQVIATLSHGYRQRVGIAGALVHDPEVLLLDEPTTGLDPRQLVEIRRLVRKLGEDRLVLLSTHLLAEASQVCDRMLVISGGKMVGLGKPDELRVAATEPTLRLVIRGDLSAVRSTVSAVDGITIDKATESDGIIELHARGAHDSRSEIARRLVADNLDILEMTVAEDDLEAVFLELTS